MSQIIKCPNCDTRSWSSDYWTCPNCGYSESREWVLLEENKDYQEGRDRGDEPKLDLGFWMREQKKLCKDMVNYLLPDYNLKPVSFRTTTQWGHTVYRENDKNRAEEMKQRMREAGYLMPNFWGGVYYKWPYLRMYGIYDQRPTEINISPHTLTTEHSTDTSYGVIGGVEGTGAGFLPTTAHESAHASKAVNYDNSFQPWINYGHDDVWKRVYIKFFNNLYQKYGEQVKKRFIEYRKITGEKEKEY